MTDSTDSGSPQPSSRSERTPPLPASTEPALLASAELADTVYDFPYIGVGDVMPSGRQLVRPALRIRLLDREHRRVAGSAALVDTGADYTTLPADWAKLLGIGLYRDCNEVEVRVVDKEPSTRFSYTDGLAIEVLGERLFLPVVMFCEGLSIGILGRRDFFDRYLILFDQRGHRMHIERRVDPDEEDRDDDPDLDANLAVS